MNVDAEMDWKDPRVKRLCISLSRAIQGLAETTKIARWTYLGSSVFLLLLTLTVASLVIAVYGPVRMALVTALVGGSGGGLAAVFSSKMMKIWDGYVAIYKAAIKKIRKADLDDALNFIQVIIPLMLSLARVEHVMFLLANGIYILVLSAVTFFLAWNQIQTAPGQVEQTTASAIGVVAAASGGSLFGTGALVLATGRMLTVWKTYQAALEEAVKTSTTRDPVDAVASVTKGSGAGVSQDPVVEQQSIIHGGAQNAI